jgi:uncharacterized protein
VAGVLIVLPPSEAKRAALSDGDPVDLGALSFPALTPLRTHLLGALVATSTRPDALARLTVGPSAADQVAENAHVTDVPARPALDVYAGALYDALDAATLPATTRRWAASRVVIVSSLWGALRPGDRIPPYRLPICAHLVDTDGLERTWRPVLGPVLTATAARHDVVVDCRSSSYQAIGKVSDDADRTVVVRVVGGGTGGRAVGGHVGKYVRGEVTRHLLDSRAEPGTPQGLADVLADRWEATVSPPSGARRTWTLDVVVPARSTASA